MSDDSKGQIEINQADALIRNIRGMIKGLEETLKRDVAEPSTMIEASRASKKIEQAFLSLIEVSNRFAKINSKSEKLVQISQKMQDETNKEKENFERLLEIIKREFSHHRNTKIEEPQTSEKEEQLLQNYEISEQHDLVASRQNDIEDIQKISQRIHSMSNKIFETVVSDGQKLDIIINTNQTIFQNANQTQHELTRASEANRGVLNNVCFLGVILVGLALLAVLAYFYL